MTFEEPKVIIVDISGHNPPICYYENEWKENVQRAKRFLRAIKKEEKK